MAMLNNKPLGILQQQNTISSGEITIHDSQHQGSLWRLVRMGGVSVQRFWWHGKAYGTIFGMMLLTLLSMMFLGFHWSYRKLILGFTLNKETAESISE
ncbi:MAG: hypothetical protein RMY34_26080 [Aulosira sp. DedQUE10]|nr:hypothetical protein [Aulosira sp. DedQUE10]